MNENDPVDVELRDLRWFLVLAEEEHFSRAAERCRVTQPTLTRSLARTERALGVRLVDRTTRSVRLTEAGQRLHAELTAVLPRLDSALRSVGERPALRLGFTWLLPSELTRRLIREFERGTGGRLELVRRDERTAGVTTGHTDAAVIHGHPSPATGLHVVELGMEERVAAVGSGHPLARRRRLRWAELAGHALVVNKLSGTVGPALWPAGARPEVAVTCRTYDEWIEMVAADRGVGVLPRSARDHPHPGVRYVTITDAPSAPLVFVRPARSPHPLTDELERIARTAAQLD
ncbi:MULTISPECIES: LysR family transcriptional regulator [unclassified Streptomyces]|uniref:LysR family transcriptional regulator n=1 Tax=unclassified Streptomyces TaxID=2593676 RepID=UPI00278C6DB8|nr:MULTISPECIES: LysR family transcriptional regulator [unclassified Streptomyces]